jgi:hypothetical protein
MARALSDHVILAVGTALAIGAAMLGASVAKADAPDPHSTVPWTGAKGDHSVTAYRADIAPEAHGTAADARTLADTICTALRSGTPEGNLIVDMAKEDQRQVGNVTMEVHGAEWHFCPDRY